MVAQAHVHVLRVGSRQSPATAAYHDVIHSTSTRCSMMYLCHDVALYEDLTGAHKELEGGYI